MIRNSRTHYGLPAKLFHWVLAVPLIVVPFFMYTIVDLPASEFKKFAYFMHKSAGVLLMMLLSLRLIWRLMNVQPELPRDLPPLLQKAIRLAHYALYALALSMTFSGMLMSLYGGHSVPFFGLFEIRGWQHNPELGRWFWQAHGVIAKALLTLIGLHVLGALWHHYVRRDQVLRRMWFS